jgi:hypothetical protein
MNEENPYESPKSADVICVKQRKWNIAKIWTNVCQQMVIVGVTAFLYALYEYFRVQRENNPYASELWKQFWRDTWVWIGSVGLLMLIFGGTGLLAAFVYHRKRRSQQTDRTLESLELVKGRHRD